jgi:hypothetical protein
MSVEETADCWYYFRRSVISVEEAADYYWYKYFHRALNTKFEKRRHEEKEMAWSFDVLEVCQEEFQWRLFRLLLRSDHQSDRDTKEWHAILVQAMIKIKILKLRSFLPAVCQ